MSGEFRFFPRGDASAMSEAESEAYESPEAVGKRIVERLEQLLPLLVNELPPVAREYVESRAQPQWHPLFTVNSELRLHLQHPHVALNECCRFALSIPEFRPDWIDFTERQATVWQALSSIRRAFLAAPSEAPGQSLQLLEHAIWMGHHIAELHVQQHESKVHTRQITDRNLQSGAESARQQEQIDSRERWDRWQQEADEMWKDHESWSKSEVGRQIVKQRPDLAAGNTAAWIAKKIVKPK